MVLCPSKADFEFTDRSRQQTCEAMTLLDVEIKDQGHRVTCLTAIYSVNHVTIRSIMKLDHTSSQQGSSCSYLVKSQGPLKYGHCTGGGRKQTKERSCRNLRNESSRHRALRKDRYRVTTAVPSLSHTPLLYTRLPVSTAHRQTFLSDSKFAGSCLLLGAKKAMKVKRPYF